MFVVAQDGATSLWTGPKLTPLSPPVGMPHNVTCISPPAAVRGLGAIIVCGTMDGGVVAVPLTPPGPIRVLNDGDNDETITAISVVSFGDGEAALVGTASGIVDVYNLADGEVLARVAAHAPHGITSLSAASSHDGLWLTSDAAGRVSMWRSSQDGVVRVTSVDFGRGSPNVDPIACFAGDDSDTLLVTGVPTSSHEGPCATLYSPGLSAVLDVIPLTAPVTCARPAADLTAVALSCSDNSLVVIANSGDRVVSIEDDNGVEESIEVSTWIAYGRGGSGRAVTGLGWLGEGDLVVSVSDSIEVW